MLYRVEWFSLCFYILLMVPVGGALALNELLAPRLHYCGYTPSLFIRALILLDMVVSCWIGWSMTTGGHFEPFQLFILSMINELDLIRDVLACIHVLAPAITLTLVIMFPKECDPSERIPVSYSVFYWAIIAFQMLFGFMVFIWICLAEFVPIFTKTRKFLTMRTQRQFLNQILKQGNPIDIDTLRSAKTVLSHGSPVFWQMIVVPILSDKFSYILTYQQVQVVTQQGRQCFTCKTPFKHKEAVSFTAGCRHLFHSNCYLSNITASPYCQVCKCNLANLVIDEILEKKQMNRHSVDQEISILPVVPPSNETLIRNTN